VLSGPISFLLASDNFLPALQNALSENISRDIANRTQALADVAKILDILRERKELYRRRRPTLVNMMSALEIERFLHHGFIGRNSLPEDEMRRRKALARAEIEHFAALIDEHPIGMQIGIVMDTLPHTGLHLFRQPDRKLLVLRRSGSAANPMSASAWR
jgi:hypothetical protein